LLTSSSTNASGDGGDLSISTGGLIVEDDAAVTVDNQGTGNAGNLAIAAEGIFLNNQGVIAAKTFSGEGGNIQLQTQEIIHRGNSSISTTAGNLGNGGNITINTETLVGLENSDITANAQRGAGGRVTLNAQGIFGSKFREQLTPESDITASSEFGLSGTVTINNPEVDPASGLIELSENIGDSTEQIGSGCIADQENSFIITGRGGLPEDPTKIIRGTSVWRDLRDFSLVSDENRQLSSAILSAPPDRTETPIVEANALVINDQGQMELIATFPNSPPLSWSPASNCQAVN